MHIDPVEILLVEDRDEDAEMAMRAFKRAKLANRITRVSDGAEALSCIFGAAGNVPNPTLKLVLLDLKLPKVNGMDVLRRLKSDPRTVSVPVVVLTSSREDRDLEEAYKLGVNSYIVKPVDFEQFVHCVEQLGVYWMVLNQPLIG
jgi:CheY-like chemotaxis protein